MLAKKIILGFGIAILLPMLVYYGLSSFVHRPFWKDYQIEDYSERYDDATPLQKAALEKERKELNNKWKEDNEVFERYFFYAAIPIGIVVTIGGIIVKIQAVGAGLMVGGIVTLLWGCSTRWAELPAWIRFVSLLVVFLCLVGFGISKIQNGKDKDEK
ncbi:MAG: hypothetical protein ABII88_07665 [Candidatus Omnitrophota bacterium]